MQTTRLTEVVQDWERALEDARSRANLNEDTDNARSWRENHYDADERYDPQRPIRVPTFALRAQVAIELAFFLVAVRNVQRAQERLPANLRLGRAIRLSCSISRCCLIGRSSALPPLRAVLV